METTTLNTAELGELARITNAGKVDVRGGGIALRCKTVDHADRAEALLRKQGRGPFRITDRLIVCGKRSHNAKRES